MEKIVYILGAGFSAPLGLPVMSNFLEKSKDQYFEHPEKYSHFMDIFERELKQVHIASDHYQTNVFNIEDILSILEFRARLDNSEDGEQRLAGFLNYLKDVIRFHTPTERLLENPDSLFHDNKWSEYIRFVAAILNCNFQNLHSPARILGYGDKSHIFSDFERKDHYYSVITFNYDLVLESIEKYLETFGSKRRFHRSVVIDDPRNQTRFAKLHGSIDGDIIPPTWNKGLNLNMVSDWKAAYKALSEANQIRILGYSLPLTDTYFRYLLRATIIDTPNLRWIDVICKDDNGNVKKSYDEFIKYPKYRFVSAAIEDYLAQNRLWDNNGGRIYFALEQAHETFVKHKLGIL
jgi:hypothetical protein